MTRRISTRGKSQWDVTHGNASWQRERQRGTILPMEQPRLSFWRRLWGKS